MLNIDNKIILIDEIDDYINDAEGELDFIKSKLIDFLYSKYFDINDFKLRKNDISEFLCWYNEDKDLIDRVSFERCVQIINFMFCEKIKD